jgi:hypothetical protein
VNPTIKTAARLRRGVGARLFGGSNFQLILTCGVVLNVVLLGVVASFDGLTQVLPAEAPALVWWVIWGMGVTAHAAADEAGVHWRYFLRHKYAWNEIDQIRFGGVLRGATPSAGAPAILISVAGREHPVVPALGCDRTRATEFGTELTGLAGAHGVRAIATPDHAFWDGLRTAYND